MPNAIPAFTVIVALYNCERYIADCLKSLKAQSFNDFEALVVDDCSTDNGLAVARSTAEGDERFRLLSTSANSGQGAARNIALAQAQGQIVVLLDADDLLVPHALQRIAERFEEQQLDDLYFNAESFYENAEAHRRVVEDFAHRDDFPDIATGMELFTFFENRRQFFPHAALRAISHRLIQRGNIRFPEGVIHEDLLFTFQTLVLSERSSFLNEPLYRRRIRVGSTMASPRRTMNNVNGHLLSIHWMRDWMLQHADELDPSFIAAMAHRLDAYRQLCSEDYLDDITDQEKEEFLATLDPRRLVQFQLEIAQRAETLRDLRNTASWRVGRMLVAPPKAARDLARRIFRKRG